MQIFVFLKGKMSREAVVFGSGDWFVKLLPGLSARGIAPTIVVGGSPVEEGQRRIEAGGSSARYVSEEQFRDIEFPEGSTGMVLSRPGEHRDHAAQLYHKGIRRVLVEKPLGLNWREVFGLQALFRQTPESVLFASDHYVFKMLSLWLMAGKDRYEGHLKPMHEQQMELNDMWGSLEQIGQVQKVTGRLIEGGEDPAGMIGHRSWLTDPGQGGGLKDLAVHLFAGAAKLKMLQGIRVTEVLAEVVDEQTGMWRPVSQFGKDNRAELLAQVVMENEHGATIDITVGKVGKTRPGIALGKYLVIEGEQGRARVNLAGPYGSTEVRLNNGQRWGAVMIGPDAYGMVAEEFMRALVGQGPDNGDVALTSVAMVELAEEVYNLHAEPKLLGNRQWNRPMIIAA